MKFATYIFLVLSIVALSVVFKIASAIYFPNSGTVRILSNPQGAVINLDNKHIGTTPFKGVLKPGEHVLKLLNNSGENKLLWEKTVNIAPEGQTEINIDFGASETYHSGEALFSDLGEGLIITTVPEGAEISIDESPSGRSSIYLDNLNPGKHQLRVSKTNYISRDLVINIIAGHRLATTVYLSKDPLVEEPKLLESSQNFSLYGIYSDDISLLNNPTIWSEGVFYIQNETGTDKAKLITETLDFQGTHQLNKLIKDKNGPKIIGYLGPKNQPITAEAKRKYDEIIGLGTQATSLEARPGQIVNSPTSSVSLRDKPDLSGSITGRINNGDQVELTGEQGPWYKIKSGTKEGWVSKEYVKLL